MDFSGSKRFGSAVRTKGDLATEVCAVLALAAARNNDRVSALFFTDRVERMIPAGKGRRHALRLISELLSFEPAGSGTDLRSALEYLESMLRRRSVLFVVSDFIATGYQSALGRLARKHDVIAVQLCDPRERELPDAGLVTLRDPERGTWRYVDTGSPRVREEFRRRMAQFDLELERGLRERGADLVRLETGQSYAEPLLAFFVSGSGCCGDDPGHPDHRGCHPEPIRYAQGRLREGALRPSRWPGLRGRRRDRPPDRGRLGHPEVPGPAG